MSNRWPRFDTPLCALIRNEFWGVGYGHMTTLQRRAVLKVFASSRQRRATRFFVDGEKCGIGIRGRVSAKQIADFKSHSDFATRGRIRRLFDAADFRDYLHAHVPIRCRVCGNEGKEAVSDVLGICRSCDMQCDVRARARTSAIDGCSAQERVTMTNDFYLVEMLRLATRRNQVGAP